MTKEPTLKPATDEDIQFALDAARQDGLPQFGDTFVLRLIARIRAERETAIRECANLSACWTMTSASSAHEAILSLLESKS